MWRESWSGLISIFLFSIFVNIARLAVPLFVLQILDRVISSRSMVTLIMLASITLCVAGAGLLLDIVRQRMFVRWGAWIERRLGRSLFHAGMLGETRGRAATPSKSLKDLATLRSFVGSSAVTAWLDVIWAPVFVLVVALVHPYLGIVLAVALAFLLAFGFLHETLTRDPRDAVSRAREGESEWIAAAERNAETIGSLSMAGNLAERWERDATTRHDESYRSRSNAISTMAAMRFCRRALRIIGLSVGVWLVIGGELTVGAIIAASILSRSAYSMVERAMLRWRNLVGARLAYRRIKDAMEQLTVDKPSMQADDAPKMLQFDDVGHRYPYHRRSVFGRITLTIMPGQIVSVIGPSASGKTTFSRLVTGVMRPRFGAIRLGEVDITRLQAHELAQSVGYLPQEVVLFRGSVRENIARMGDGDFEQVVEAARLANIHDKILKLAKGYDTEIDDSTQILSGSERKAVALARAFYGAPDLVVLDEPEANLDREARRALGRAIKTLSERGTIVIFTALTRASGRIADKVLLFADARVKLVEDAEEIAQLGRSKRTRRKKVA
ncbi:type I secretion system permease/ATPase [Pelagibius sp.]|uniref:type I secretion system permease/ATPase n=1 Tax=Pelagibius sp. TaxID=1931238 RepID=UPI00261DB53E|nr:ATP-binding cassette domain-containing protein [Pelagibius sp.]